MLGGSKLMPSSWHGSLTSGILQLDLMILKVFSNLNDSMTPYQPWSSSNPLPLSLWSIFLTPHSLLFKKQREEVTAAEVPQIRDVRLWGAGSNRFVKSATSIDRSRPRFSTKTTYWLYSPSLPLCRMHLGVRESNQWKNSGSNYSLFPDLFQDNTHTETNGKAVAYPQSLKNLSFLTFRLNLNCNLGNLVLVADCLSFKSMVWFLTTVLHYYYFASRGMELILHYP